MSLLDESGAYDNLYQRFPEAKRQLFEALAIRQITLSRSTSTTSTIIPLTSRSSRSMASSCAIDGVRRATYMPGTSFMSIVHLEKEVQQSDRTRLVADMINTGLMPRVSRYGSNKSQRSMGLPPSTPW